MFPEVIESWNQLPACQVTRCSENHHHTRIAGSSDPFAVRTIAVLRHKNLPWEIRESLASGLPGFVSIMDTVYEQKSHILVILRVPERYGTKWNINETDGVG
jgi:hypothetical protein